MLGSLQTGQRISYVSARRPPCERRIEIELRILVYVLSYQYYGWPKVRILLKGLVSLLYIV